MGITTSKNTRRISFDNTFATTPELIQKPTDTIMSIDSFEKDAAPDLNYKDTGRFINLQDEDYDYWTRRIESLKDDHQEINQIIEDTYKKTIDDTSKLFHPPKITHDKILKIKPCFEWRAKILQCYEDNPRQPLLCSAEVEAFSNCVTSCQLEE